MNDLEAGTDDRRGKAAAPPTGSHGAGDIIVLDGIEAVGKRDR